MKDIAREMVNRGALYGALGILLVICGLRAGADLLWLYEMTTAESATNFVMVIAASIGRAAIRVSNRKRANAEKANEHNDTSVKS